MANLFELPRALWIDSSGNPLAGGKLYFYEAGTSTPLDTYSDNSLSSANANPVVADSAGVWGAIYLKAQSYKVVLKTSADVQVWSQDNVHGSVSVTGTSVLLQVATIAAMTALAKAQLTANQIIEVGGYAAIGDGGGGCFYWHDGSATTANEGTVFAADEGGTGRWKRLFSGAVNVRWFGATGDGATNDTDAIQDTIDYVYANNLGTVFIPAGTYLVTALTITWADANKTVNIVGAGKRNTVIGKSGGTTTALLTLDGDAALESFSDIRDLMFEGTSKAFDGIKMVDVARFTIDNVDFNDCAKGIHSTGGLIWEARKCYFTNNDYGVYTRAGTIQSNLIKLYDCGFQTNSSFGCDIGKADGVTIENCDIEGNGTAADTATGGVILRDTGDDSTGVCKFTIRDCWFEGGKGWDVQIESMSLSLITLANLTHYNSESGRAIWVKGGHNLLVEQCFALGANDLLQVDSSVGLFTQISSFFQNVTNNAVESIYISSTAGTTSTTKSLNNYNSGGSFTPVAFGTTSAGAGTYTTQVGKWARNGNQVDFSVLLTWTAHTGTGNLRIDLNDIPYSSANESVNYPCTISVENMTFTGQMSAVLSVNSKIVVPQVLATGAAAAAVALDTSATVEISGRYRIADS